VKLGVDGRMPGDWARNGVLIVRKKLYEDLFATGTFLNRRRGR
jgi:hypothetical protein